MVLRGEIEALKVKCGCLHAKGFWQRLKVIEKRLRELMPFVPFADKRPGRRLVLGWNGRAITHTLLSPPFPTGPELEEALEALLETAANAAAIIEGDRVLALDSNGASPIDEAPALEAEDQTRRPRP